MPRLHAPIRIAPGIVQDGNALIAEVRIGNSRGTQTRLRERFPLGTPIPEMQKWQDLVRYDLGAGVLEAADVRSLADEITAFREKRRIELIAARRASAQERT